MERLTLSSEFNNVNNGIWMLKNNVPRQLITDDCDEYEYIKRLAEYEDLDEQGRVLKFPCDVGDTVYRISTGFHTRIKKIEKTKISRIAIDKSGIVFFCECNPIAKCILGKTVFLTKEEAENVLKRMEDFKNEVN